MTLPVLGQSPLITLPTNVCGALVLLAGFLRYYSRPPLGAEDETLVLPMLGKVSPRVVTGDHKLGSFVDLDGFAHSSGVASAIQVSARLWIPGI